MQAAADDPREPAAVNVEMVYADSDTPLRAVLLGSMTRAWYEATDEERRERILPRFAQVMSEWREIAAKVLATVDDDLLMVGEPRAGTTFYVIVEVAEFDDVAKMIQHIREAVGGVRLDTYTRWESRVGRPFFLLEPT
jgi:DNA-binding Lrp family transcriptional regulator